MGEAKPTPGPWHLAEGEGWISVSPNDRSDTLIADTLEGRPAEERRTNARLIAAAPDLHRELKHLVALLEPLEREGGLNVPGLATLNAARAALAKAGAS